MKNEKIEWVKYKKKIDHTLVNGRVGTNMSFWKKDEYRLLQLYVYDGVKPRYGYILPIHRFYKNFKYRKKAIKQLTKLYKEKGNVK